MLPGSFSCQINMRRSYLGARLLVAKVSFPSFPALCPYRFLSRCIAALFWGRGVAICRWSSRVCYPGVRVWRYSRGVAIRIRRRGFAFVIIFRRLIHLSQLALCRLCLWAYAYALFPLTIWQLVFGYWDAGSCRLVEVWRLAMRRSRCRCRE